VFGLYPDDRYRHRRYANVAAVLWAQTGEGGTYEFVRRLVFSVLIGNADMHLKDWSLLYPGRRTPAARVRLCRNTSVLSKRQSRAYVRRQP
jgi:serine/threonine-protein kinase HipA